MFDCFSNKRFAVVYALLFTVLAAAVATAAPVFGDRWRLRQPDGDMVEVRIWGDEFYQVVESTDGYTLVRDPSTGQVCYARLSPDGTRFESTGIRAGDPGDAPANLARHLRIPAESAGRRIDEIRALRGLVDPSGTGRAPAVDGPGYARSTIGSVTGLVILVDFDDQTATIPRDDVAGMFNAPGYGLYGNNGSVRDYFLDVSQGVLDFTNNVSPVYYRALYPFTHYDNCDYQLHEGAQELIVEALTYMEAAGHDFSQYDNDGDGYIDALSLMYAGTTACGWARGMWSGSGFIQDQWSADGVATRRYLAVGMGESLGIGAFCHESGHMLCAWPDLYDYEGDSEGVGKYCLMANFASRTNPVEPCAYLKYLAGWGDVTELVTPSPGLLLPPSSDNVFYRFPNPWFDNEYFLIENRRQSGRDAEVPDNGLALWKIDTEGSNSWNQRLPDFHYEVTLVQADNRWDLESDANSGDDTDLFAAPEYTRATPCSYPDTDGWNGADTGLYIKNIGVSADTMRFDFALGGPPSLASAGVETVSRFGPEWTIRVALVSTTPDDAVNVGAVLYSLSPEVAVTDPDCSYALVTGNLPDTGAPDQYVLDLSGWPGGAFNAGLYATYAGECGGSYTQWIPFSLEPPAVIPVVFNALSARVSPGAIEIRWQVSADEAISGFDVYRSGGGFPGPVRLNAAAPLDPGSFFWSDTDIRPGETYTYEVAAVLGGGGEIRSGLVRATAAVAVAGMDQNRPNPFRESTSLDYRLDRETRVTIRVYDVAGRLVRTLVDRVLPAGAHSAGWDGRDAAGRLLPSGVYFCRFKAGRLERSRRMLIVR